MIDSEEAAEALTTPLEHFYLNFGDIELQNKVTDLVSTNVPDDLRDLYKMFEKVNSEILADFVYQINVQQDRDIDKQLCLQAIIDYQFEITEKRQTMQGIFYVMFFAIPFGIMFFFQEDYNKWAILASIIAGFIVNTYFAYIEYGQMNKAGCSAYMA